MMAHFKSILAILIVTALAQGEGSDDSPIKEDDGVGCRLDKLLRLKKSNL